MGDGATNGRRGWAERHFPSVTLTLIPIGVALNLVVTTLVHTVKLPLYLDSIGTVVVAILGGAWPAVVTGALTQAVGGLLIDPVLPWYTGTALAVGWFAGLCAGRGWFRSWLKWGACGLVMGLIAGVISAPVTTYLFGGITPGGASLVVAFLLSTGRTVLHSVLLTGITCDPVDKCLTFLIAAALVRGLPRRLVAQFPRGRANMGPAPAPVKTPPEVT